MACLFIIVFNRIVINITIKIIAPPNSQTNILSINGEIPIVMYVESVSAKNNKADKAPIVAPFSNNKVEELVREDLMFIKEFLIVLIN